MPRTIEKGFLDFHSKIKATAAETAATVSHRSSIEACLRSNFGLNRFVRIGSFGNGTNISSYSDVDYLACIPTNQLTQSSTYSLQKVRNALKIRFPNSDIAIRCPTVFCPFGTYRSQDTEIVVADHVDAMGGHKIYEIADGNGDWMRICPDAHNAYVQYADDHHSGKVKPLIRFIKAWKFFRNVSISSFYLEMRVAKYALGERAIVFDIDVKNLLSELCQNGLSAMQDPTGFSGYIYPCKTQVLRTDALSKLATAVNRAEKARLAECQGDTKTSFEWWQLLFGEKFPSYYL